MIWEVAWFNHAGICPTEYMGQIPEPGEPIDPVAFEGRTGWYAEPQRPLVSCPIVDLGLPFLVIEDPGLGWVRYVDTAAIVQALWGRG